MADIIQLPLKMPPELAQQVAILTLPPNPDYAGHPPLEPEYNPAAGEWLRRKRDLIKQASREDCHDWLVLLSHGINGVAQDILERRELAIWAMCRDLPALVWCEATMVAMWVRTAFLPSPGECREVLEAHVAPLLGEIAALERIAAIQPPRPMVALPAYEPPLPPEWVGSRHVPGLGVGGEDVAPLGDAVRRVMEQQLAQAAAKEHANEHAKGDASCMQTDAKDTAKSTPREFFPRNFACNGEPDSDPPEAG